MRFTLMATLVAGSLSAVSAHALDLLQVYREALANDSVYASARATLAAGQEKSALGKAVLLPALGASGSQLRNDPQTGPDFTSTSYAIRLTQPLLNWSSWEQYQQGKLSVAASEAQFAQAQQDLIVRVSQSYFDVLAAQDALASVQAQKTAITEQLASAKRNFEVGTTTITDTHEAQARYDLTVAQEFAAQSDLDIKRAALQQVMGKPPGELATLRPGVKLAGPVPSLLDQWVESAEQQSYGVIGQQFLLEIARREINRTRAGHLPTVDLVASRSRTTQPASIVNPTGTSTSTAVGVQWNIPLFAGFGVTSRTREAIALEDKARSDLETARRTAAQGARQAYLGINSGLAQVRALEAAELSSQSALDSNRLGYQVGVRINIDVLNAQQQLFTTRQNLSKARYDTIINGLRLKSAAGTLKEEDLVQVNALLKP